jgi:hypothetical protein
MRLTDETISRLRPSKDGRPLAVLDQQTPGLYLTVWKSTARTWSVMYKVRGAGGTRPNGRLLTGTPQRATLGPFPHISLRSAREQARKIRDEAADGRDPKVERAATEASQKARLTPHGIAITSQVRDHLKAQPDGERLNWVRNAITSGDKFTVAAILSAPPYLSGLTPEALDLIRAQAATQFAPKEYAQLRATRDAITRVQHAGSQLLGKFGPIMQRGLNSPEAVAAAALKKLAG